MLLLTFEKIKSQWKTREKCGSNLDCKKFLSRSGRYVIKLEHYKPISITDETSYITIKEESVV